MSSRDSGQWRHLSKLRRTLNECTTFSQPESTYWNNVMLFFHKRWWLKKKKKIPNRCTVLASVWSDHCGVTSRRFWPAVYWKKSDPMLLFSGENHSCQCPMSSFKEKKKEILEYCYFRERGTSWSRKPSSLRSRITFLNFFYYYYYFSQTTIIWHYKM